LARPYEPPSAADRYRRKPVLKLGLQVMEALERAERSQIVHRDVKPENIMQDSAGGFWLLDFGIARHLDLSSLTASGLPYRKMTLGYAPPEQCRNFKREIDSRADLFALGVTMHECATVRMTFLTLLRAIILNSLGAWSNFLCRRSLYRLLLRKAFGT